MAKYIDVDELKKQDFQDFSCTDVWCAIDNCPTADVKPIVRGEWIKTNNVVYTAHGKYDVYECSFCKNDVTIADFNNYCPCCGAKM